MVQWGSPIRKLYVLTMLCESEHCNQTDTKQIIRIMPKQNVTSDQVKNRLPTETKNYDLGADLLYEAKALCEK